MTKGFPGITVVKNLSASAGDARDSNLIHGWGRCCKVGNGNPVRYSHLGNSMDRRDCRDTVHGVPKSLTPLRDWHTHMWLTDSFTVMTGFRSRTSLLHSTEEGDEIKGNTMTRALSGGPVITVGKEEQWYMSF